MDKEFSITNSGYDKIFHPALLKNFIVKKNDHAIIPQYSGSDKIDEWTNFSTTKTTFNSLTSNEIDNIIFGTDFFLSVNLQINSLNDIFPKIDDLITANRKLETIDLILNATLYNFNSQIDDIYIDKFIDFYQKYFSLFFKTQVEYKKIFKEIQKSLQNKNIPIHSEIVNNILKK